MQPSIVSISAIQTSAPNFVGCTNTPDRNCNPVPVSVHGLAGGGTLFWYTLTRLIAVPGIARNGGVTRTKIVTWSPWCTNRGHGSRIVIRG